jgi:type II secretory pathway component GspD/PulD (secretin)
LPTDSGTVNGSANDISIPGEAAFQRSGGAGGGGGALGGGGAAGGGGAGGAGGGALQAGTGFTPDGIRRVTYDPTDNSLIVEGDDEAIQQLRQLVAFFDQVPKQVVIKVEFITTSQSIIKSLGMDWLYQRGAVNAGNRPGTLARVSDPIFINYATGNITTRLRTLINEGDGKTVNAPLVRTLNNQTAIVNQTTQTTVFLASTTNGAGGVTTTFNPTTLTINTGLQVRPRINDDGWVTMTLAPQISDFGQVRRGPDGQEIPDVLSQQIRVVARVRSGQTIALAGLNRKSTTNSTSRFPILSDLPIIGQLFRSSSVQRNDSELLIFVTPYVVEDDTNGGLTP